MSLGIHRCWKDRFVKALNPGPDTFLLDAAGGTGDIAMRTAQHIRAKYGGSSFHIRVVDINPSMLKVGQERCNNMLSEELSRTIGWELGNAEHLDAIPDASVDAYTIAFGIRNCTHISKVLLEAHRVLKRGGRFLCLEFSTVQNPSLRKFYH